MPLAASSRRRRGLAQARPRAARSYLSRDMREAARTWLPPTFAAAAFLVIYFLGNLDIIDTPPALAIDAFLLACMVLYFPMRYARRLGRRGRIAAGLLAVVWVGVIYYPIFRRIYPGERLANVDAKPELLPLRLPTAGFGDRLDVVIDGHLERAETRATRAARYSLTLQAEGQPPETVTGEFKESWFRQRQGRRESVELHRAQTATTVVVENPNDGDVLVTAMSVRGRAAEALTLSVYRHSLPPWWLAFVLAAILFLAAVVFDRASGAGDTAASLTIATGAALTAALSFPSIGSPHPSFRELFGAGIAGALLGGPIGGLVAWIFQARQRAPGYRAARRAR